jgi:hypothetical protein
MNFPNYKIELFLVNSWRTNLTLIEESQFIFYVQTFLDGKPARSQNTKWENSISPDNPWPETHTVSAPASPSSYINMW